MWPTWWWPQALMQPEILILRSPISSWRDGEPLGDALRDRDRAGVGERAIVEARAGDDVGDEPGVGLGQADVLQRGIDGTQVLDAHVRQHQVLLVRDAHLVEGIALGEIGDGVHLLGAGIARDAADRLQRDGDKGVARLLVGVRVARHPALEAAVGRAQRHLGGPAVEGRRGEIRLDAADLGLGQLERALADALPLLLHLRRRTRRRRSRARGS